MKSKLRDTLNQNLRRVESLVQTYESHPEVQGQGRKKAEVLDILRAAVVLLHASLEDVLRGIARWKLPSATGDVLNEVPFAGTGPTPRKLLLGDLAVHRGKSVDEVIDSSVQAYLERSNYNNTGEISSLLTSVGVDVSKVSGRFKGLQEMMSRRHQIVHRADRQDSVAGSGDHQIRAINRGTVREWIADVKSFSTDLFAQL